MNKQRMILAALAVSVVLNAGVAGFVIARMSGDGPPRVDAGPMAPELGAMAEARMREMRQAMRVHQTEMRANAKAMKAAHQQAAEVLRQSELDEQQLRETFAEIRRLREANEIMMQEALITAAGQMDAREREKLARYIERRARLSQRDRRREERRPPPEVPKDAPAPEDQNQ